MIFREEGLVPYMPEIPVPPELFLSYNHTIEKISNIYTVPAALESTSLILVTGLDIFFTVRNFVELRVRFCTQNFRSNSNFKKIFFG